MSDLLSIGTSGILAYKRSLSTVGNNIANVDTVGYSRQIHSTEQDIGSTSALINLGNGVLSESVRRSYDAFATSAYRNSNSLLEQQETLYAYANKLENIMGDANLSLTSVFDKFFASAQALVASPASGSARQGFLTEAKNVAERFKLISQQFDQLDVDSAEEIGSRVDSLNSLTKQLSIINYSLMAKSDVNNQPGGLLDQRDQLLQEISTLIKIESVEKANGVVDVYIGNKGTGLQLLKDVTPVAVKASISKQNSEKVELTLDPYGEAKPLGNGYGGKLAGIQDFRGNTLANMRSRLDDIANAFMDSVNGVQLSGLDAQGNIGKALFGVAEDVTRVAGHMQVLLTGVDDIATASPLIIDQNSETASLKLDSWDTSTLAVNGSIDTNITIAFTAGDEYEVRDSEGNVIETVVYQPGDKISGDGWVASVVNTPSEGDVFVIKTNNAPKGDNRNILAMAALQTDREVFNGLGSFGEIYADVLNELGSIVVQSSISRDAQKVLTDEAQTTKDAASGVSLDEEAANLLRFQQAYQANAQIIQTSNRLFEAILNAR